MKRLSIIIPTYNMECYIAKALDSIVRCSRCDDIEAVVVNDGSRDASLAIANGYAEQYPATVRVIDKSNGNYGSTINAALPQLQGEYVKILDADDTFDTAALGRFVEHLEALSGVDMVITPYIEISATGSHRCDYDLYGKQRFELNRPYLFDEVIAGGAMRQFAMHAITYRTDLLRKSHYRQTEGISYTDREWAFYPLFYLNSIAFSDEAIYLYNIAREGQTMDSRVMLRSIDHLQRVAMNMGSYFVREPNALLSTVRRQYLRGAIEERLRVIFRLYLIAMPDDMFVSEAFDRCYTELVAMAKGCGIERLVVRQNAMLPPDVLHYWERRHRRLPKWRRSMIMWLDRVMVMIYSRLFR